jgi:hypothetical protein
MNITVKDIYRDFRIFGDFIEAFPYGTGHINNTYKAIFSQSGKTVSYIFQRINKTIFKKPEELMVNISLVLEYQKKALADTPNSSRRSLTLIPTKADRCFYIDKLGEYWRAYCFIENAATYDIIENDKIAYNAARAFGKFQRSLTELSPSKLNITIPNFHNTPKRYEAFEDATVKDTINRAKDVKSEIDFVLNHKKYASKLFDLHRDGKLPERICHYDTKLNNVMIDDKTKEGICVIDLDTVMPGFTAFDFGDLIRTGTSPAAEDELDTSKVCMQMNMFESIARGYLSSAETFLTKTEKENLVFGGLLITLENALRFLMDYLQGDIYYKIHRENHNLDRCRTQIALVKSIENQFDKMNNIIENY